MKSFKRFCYICIATFILILYSGGCHFINENNDNKNYVRKTDSIKKGKRIHENKPGIRL